MVRTVWRSLAVAVAAASLAGSASAQTVLWANPSLPGDEMLPPAVTAPELPPAGDPADVWPQGAYPSQETYPSPNAYRSPAYAQPQGYPQPQPQPYSQQSSVPVPSYSMPFDPVMGSPASGAPYSGPAGTLPQQLPPAMPAPTFPTDRSTQPYSVQNESPQSDLPQSDSPQTYQPQSFPSTTYQTTVQSPSQDNRDARETQSRSASTPRPTWQIPSAAKVWNSAHRFRR